MPDEVRIFSLLGSWLYGSMIHATGVLGRAFESDLTAVRVYGIKDLEHASFVDTARLGLSSRQDKLVQAWPVKQGELFDQILRISMRDGVFDPRDVIDKVQEAAEAAEPAEADGTPESASQEEVRNLYAGLSDVITVRDCLCMSMTVYSDIWASVALMRRQGSKPFDEKHQQTLKKVKPAVAHMLRSGCARQGLTAQPATPRKRSGSNGKRYSTDQIIAKLTRTECQVLGYLRLAATEREISQEVHRSPHTVHVHVKNIYRKLEVSSRSELMELFGDTLRD